MSAEKSSIEINVSNDLLNAEISVGLTVGARSGVQLTANELDNVIAMLAQARANMLPGTPESFPQGKPTHRHEATNYYFGIDPVGRIPVLSFRTRGFGWLSFALQLEEAEKLGRQMLGVRDHLKMLNRSNN